MGDNHGGPAAAAVPAFLPVAQYMILISYSTGFGSIYVCGKLNSTYLLLTSVIKLTLKLRNILTDLWVGMS
jgi:hypothetical protein